MHRRPLKRLYDENNESGVVVKQRKISKDENVTNDVCEQREVVIGNDAAVQAHDRFEHDKTTISGEDEYEDFEEWEEIEVEEEDRDGEITVQNAPVAHKQVCTNSTKSLPKIRENRFEHSRSKALVSVDQESVNPHQLVEGLSVHAHPQDVDADIENEQGEDEYEDVEYWECYEEEDVSENITDAGALNLPVTPLKNNAVGSNVGYVEGEFSEEENYDEPSESENIDFSEDDADFYPKPDNSQLQSVDTCLIHEEDEQINKDGETEECEDDDEIVVTAHGTEPAKTCGVTKASEPATSLQAYSVGSNELFEQEFTLSDDFEDEEECALIALINHICLVTIMAEQGKKRLRLDDDKDTPSPKRIKPEITENANQVKALPNNDEHHHDTSSETDSEDETFSLSSESEDNFDNLEDNEDSDGDNLGDYVSDDSDDNNSGGFGDYLSDDSDDNNSGDFGDYVSDDSNDNNSGDFGDYVSDNSDSYNNGNFSDYVSDGSSSCGLGDYFNDDSYDISGFFDDDNTDESDSGL